MPPSAEATGFLQSCGRALTNHDIKFEEVGIWVVVGRVHDVHLRGIFQAPLFK